MSKQMAACGGCGWTGRYDAGRGMASEWDHHVVDCEPYNEILLADDTDPRLDPVAEWDRRQAAVAVPDSRRQQAQDRATRIRDGLGRYAATVALVDEAIRDEDWRALGYASMREWFGTEQIGELWRAAEQPLRDQVTALKAAGLSVRQAAGMLGVSQSSANRAVSGTDPHAARKVHKFTSESPKALTSGDGDSPAADVAPSGLISGDGATLARPEADSAPSPQASEPELPEGAAGNPDSEPQPCPRCAELGQLLAERCAELLQVYERIEALEAQLSAGPIAAEQPEPHTDPQEAPQEPDSAEADGGGAPERDTRRPCGSSKAARVQLFADGELVHIAAPSGTEMEWLCPQHREKLAAGTGLEVVPAPADRDPLDFDTDQPCQFPVPAEVPVP